MELSQNCLGMLASVATLQNWIFVLICKKF